MGFMSPRLDYVQTNFRLGWNSCKSKIIVGATKFFLTPYNPWQVCNTKSHAKGKKDNHFLVGVSEREFSAR